MYVWLKIMRILNCAKNKYSLTSVKIFPLNNNSYFLSVVVRVIAGLLTYIIVLVLIKFVYILCQVLRSIFQSYILYIIILEGTQNMQLFIIKFWINKNIQKEIIFDFGVEIKRVKFWQNSVYHLVTSENTPYIFFYKNQKGFFLKISYAYFRFG